MKKQLLTALLLTFSVGSVCADTANVLPTTTEVTSGRNLRNSGTQQCEVVVSNGGLGHAEATVIIHLPKGARVLSTRVKRPSAARSHCSKLRSGTKNTVQCKLTRLIPNQKITLITRYRQTNPARGRCSGYIKAGSGH
ncbi:MAG: hypothetical protein CSB47_01500 [Proteobacteria bacterium]|nr:MAG: hypothetical protein CSB47_01500 [Pseudomonadota bacterium]